MKTEINSPVTSKINWTALVVALLGVVSATGVIPEEVQEPLTDAAMIAGPALIMVFRTWFTEPQA